MIATNIGFKKIFLIITVIVLVLSFVIVYGIGREKKLVIKLVQDQLIEKFNTNLTHLNKHETEKKYLIKDIDNYGRNWTVYAENQNSNVIIFNVHSARGIGPIPLMNSLNSLDIMDIEEQVLSDK